MRLLLTIFWALMTTLCVSFGAEKVSLVVTSVTREEKKTMNQWVGRHLLDAKPELPFSFVYDGKTSEALLAEWPKTVATKTLDAARSQHILTWTDPITGLEVRCVAVTYRDFPTVEWTLHFKNTGAKDSPVISRIQALDTTFRKSGQGAFLLHHNVGSPCSTNDYAPRVTPLAAGAKKRIGAAGGRPTNSDMSYFNLEWSGSEGMIVVVGWPGQWAADFVRDTGDGIAITAGQELTHFKLLPGEAVRSPLMVLQYWKGGDWIRAQNVWCRWMLAHNVPRPSGKLPEPELFGCSSHFTGEMTGATEENQIQWISRFLEEKIDINHYWMDAGWYACKGWQETGTWEVDLKRFPRGLRAISDYAHTNGVKTILWFEPERVAAGTWLAENHAEWILGGKKGGLLNLGNAEALQWLVGHVDTLMKEQGIDLYRQDFNMDPLNFWRENDAPDRQGITENKHVVGYLAYWDELLRRHPDMFIDACASGGRRNDLETMRRAIPLWRSDCRCEPVATQGQTYGISLWLPLSGTGAATVDRYIFRSNMAPFVNCLWNMSKGGQDFDLMRRLTGEFAQIANYWYGDYYPLVDQDAWMAWQFDRPDLKKGVVQVFRRDKAPAGEIRIKLRGLDADATYELNDFDKTVPSKVSGRELMATGLLVTLPPRAAAVIVYSAPNVVAANALCPVGDTVAIGHIKEFSILIPEKATAQEKFSAAMLADYLEKIFKVKLPVVQEPQSVNGQIISVGNTARAKTAGVPPDPREQAFKLAVSDGNLYILGGTRGPIYGVIALLEEDLGVRWYAGNDAPVVPLRPKDELTVVPRSYSPPFEIREPLYSDAFNAPWAIFNRIQPISYYTRIGLESGGGLANPDYFIHTYDQLIPAGEYFASHPEYFPLREGKRVPSKQTNGQLCYTCPGLIDTLAQKLDVAIGQNPGTRIYSVSANDNHNSNCECPSCQDIIKVDGVSGAQLYLANEVAKKLAVKYPDIKITTLAYNISQKPPKNIKLGPNTVIIYAPIAQRGRAMLSPIGDIKVIADELAGWHKIASSIYLWDYVDMISGAPEPFPNFDAQDGALKFLSDNGVTGVFMQGCYQGHGSLGELKSWLYTKKLWNPRWSQDELIKEFVASYYGPAAAEMSEYVSLQRQAWANFYRARKTGLKFSNAEIEQMYKLLNSAIVRCGDRGSDRVKFERELLTLLCLSLAPNPCSATATNYASTLNQAEELISKLKIKNFGEGTTVEDKLRTWHNKLKRATVGNGLPKYSENALSLKEPFYPEAKYLTDPDAAIGYATRQAGGSDAWGVQWPYGDFIDLLNPDTTYIVRMRAKPEFKTTPQKSGNLFIFNSYTTGGANPGTCGSSFDGKFSVNDNNKYRWFVLGKLQIVTSDAVGYLYCVSGELSKDEAVWYDYLEFIPENEFEDKALADKLPLIKIQ